MSKIIDFATRRTLRETPAPVQHDCDWECFAEQHPDFSGMMKITMVVEASAAAGLEDQWFFAWDKFIQRCRAEKAATQRMANAAS
ncbi:hypothetical protein NKH61_24550 [Mesorhizobium sp. M1005]|uniref:hypothetical protein n=1 Tax=unclassified Mesorhizobium TaxID=325217 RepID=UPI00333C9701